MKRFLTLLIILIVAVAAGAYWFLRAGLPDYTTSIEAAGLSAPVTVERNRFAVPSITAQNMEDLYFAWGYVNAQDRMFQADGYALRPGPRGHVTDPVSCLRGPRRRHDKEGP